MSYNLLVLLVGFLALGSELLGVSGRDISERCTEPPTTLKCKATFTRYYYDKETKKCVQYSHRVCPGYGNNFSGMDECRQKCERAGIIPTHCVLPLDTGKCRQKVQRYYYDIKMKKCQSFTYGGCRGNRNNFENIRDCIWECELFGKKSQLQLPLTVQPDRCTLPVKKGMCKFRLLRYYYNIQTNTCLQFVYGGCDANENNFENLRNCIWACERFDIKTRERYLPETTRKRCTLPQKTGNCKAGHSHYHYNMEKNKCEMFLSGGCGSNANNFENIEECIKMCEHGY